MTDKSMKKSNLEKEVKAASFEKKLNRLEEIVKKMEEGELSLDESLRVFEEGIQLARECHHQLNDAEQKVKVLVGIDSEGRAEFSEYSASDEDNSQ